jgi:hypothetical protein
MRAFLWLPSSRPHGVFIFGFALVPAVLAISGGAMSADVLSSDRRIKFLVIAN